MSDLRVEARPTLRPADVILLRRAVSEAVPDDVDHTVDQLLAGLEAGEMAAFCLYEGGDDPRGIALWRWADAPRTAAEVDWLYVDRYAPHAHGMMLVESIFDLLGEHASLEMMAIRVRGEAQGVRIGLARRDAVIFERCLMVRDLQAVPPPEVAPPNGYTLATWEDSHQAAVEKTAETSHRGGIDSLVVVEARPDRLIASLRDIRAGHHEDMRHWYEDGSLVALAPDGSVAGYIAVVDMTTMAFVADLGVSPRHRRRGLARALVAHSMTISRQANFPAMALAVTMINPARHLYQGLGFQSVNCGKTAVWWRDGRQLNWQPK